MPINDPYESNVILIITCHPNIVKKTKNCKICCVYIAFLELGTINMYDMRSSYKTYVLSILCLLYAKCYLRKKLFIIQFYNHIFNCFKSMIKL